MIKPATILTAMFIALFYTNSFAGDIDTTRSLTDLMTTQDLSDRKKERDKNSKNRRISRPVGFNVYGFGPTGMVGGSLDGFLTPKLAIEAGAGLENTEGDINYFVGGRYHILGGTRLNLTPYAGVYTSFHYNGRDVQNHAIYVPVGIHKIKKSGFTWSAEIGYQKSTRTDKNLSGGFRIGYRF